MMQIGSGIIIKNKRILLIKRKYSKSQYPNYWAPPGGRKEENEKIINCTIREVKEEVGLDFTPEKLFLKQENEHSIHYRYIGKFKGDIKIQETECDGYGWFNYEESVKLLISDSIKELFNKLKNENIL